MAALTLDVHHTTHYGAGYLANLVQPRLALASHVSFDRELIGEMMAGVRLHYQGMFAFGIDHTVVNVTKDRLWIREAALPDTANIARPTPQWMMQNIFGGKAPTVLPKQQWTIAGNQEKAVRDLEIDPALFTPQDQMRPWVREWPEGLTPADLFGGQVTKK
jgi:ribonuclease Z